MLLKDLYSLLDFALSLFTDSKVIFIFPLSSLFHDLNFFHGKWSKSLDMLVGKSWSFSCFNKSHDLSSMRESRVNCSLLRSKFERSTKFPEIARLVSKLSTVCGHPAGTNNNSPGMYKTRNQMYKSISVIFRSIDMFYQKLKLDTDKVVQYER